MSTCARAADVGSVYRVAAATIAAVCVQTVRAPWGFPKVLIQIMQVTAYDSLMKKATRHRMVSPGGDNPNNSETICRS